MDQNPNNDLFEFDNTQSQPPSQGSTPPPTGGARVYDTNEGAQPAEPAYTPVPPPYTPPPSTPPAQASNRNRTIWIVVIVAVVLLCCCLLALALVALVAFNFIPVEISRMPLSLLQIM